MIKWPVLSRQEAVCDVTRLPPTVFHIILKLWIFYHYVSNFSDKLSILKESNALMNSVILYLLNKSFFPLFFNGKNDDSGVHALPDLLNFC